MDSSAFVSDFELYHPDGLKDNLKIGDATWPPTCETSVHDLFDDETHTATVNYIRTRIATFQAQNCTVKWIKLNNNNNNNDNICINEEWQVVIDPGDNYIMPVVRKSTKNKISDEKFLEEEDDEKICCKICQENRVTHCFDCGHIVCCHHCTKKLIEGNDKKCPICRVPIVKPIRVYFT